jgi:hypothetical protein
MFLYSNQVTASRLHSIKSNVQIRNQVGQLRCRVSRGPLYEMNAFRRIKGSLPTFKKGSESRRFAVEFSLTFGGMCLFTTYVFGFTVCVGESMVPTLDAEGQLVLIDRFSYRIQGKSYEVGDVIISQSKNDPSKSELLPLLPVFPHLYTHTGSN